MKALLTIISLFFCLIGFSQTDIEIKTVEDLEVIKLFNKIQLRKKYRTENLSVKIYSLANNPGSAGYANGETTDNLYFAVSEYDEYPNQSLFRVDNLYAAKIENIVSLSESKILIELSYIESNKKKTLKLELTINELKKANR